MMVVMGNRFVAVVTVYGMPKADCEELLRRKFAQIIIKKTKIVESSLKFLRILERRVEIDIFIYFLIDY